VPAAQGVGRAFLSKPHTPEAPREISPTRVMLVGAYLLGLYHGSVILTFIERLYWVDKANFVAALPSAIGILTVIVGVPAGLALYQKIIDARPNGSDKPASDPVSAPPP